MAVVDAVVALVQSNGGRGDGEVVAVLREQLLLTFGQIKREHVVNAVVRATQHDLAGKIVLGGPYDSVDDVLSLDLTERQQELFAKYRDNFTVTPPSIALNEGDDRINDGQYR